MRPVSAKFLSAASGSYRMGSRVRLVATGQNGVTPTAATLPDGSASLQVQSGAVTLDRTAQTRGTLDLVVLGYAWPPSSSDPLIPYGAYELFVERGIVYGDGTTEWVSQGYYRINDLVQRSTPYGSIEITASDRMSTVIDDKITSPVSFAAGTSVLAIVENLVWAVCPWAVIDYDPSVATSTITAAQVTGSDRYQFLNDLITSYGLIWYWDYRGRLYIHFPPNPNVPVLSVTSGQGGVLLTESRQLSRTGIFNGCVASGQNTAAAVFPSALARDLNPNSPTYWFGNFGQVPQFYNSSMITTLAQGVAAANLQLQLTTGMPYNANFTMVPNPAIEPFDCISLSNRGLVERHVLDKVVIPLDAGTAQSCVTRQQTIGSFG